MADEVITPELLLSAYASGLFPMAEDRDDQGLFWVDPDERGILPLDTFHVSRTLRKRIRQQPFDIRVDTDFISVMRGCAESKDGRPYTWISERIEKLYTDLHRIGYAHSVECWLDNELVGGLYGVSLQGAFFGESMFHRATDASKIALVYLVAILRSGGYVLLDTQFSTDHLKQFGVIDVPKQEYKARLDKALQKSGTWSSNIVNASPEDVLHASTQTS